MTDEVKKRGRPKKDGTQRKDNKPKTPEAAENQKATQFQKGQSGNPGGTTMRRPTYQFRMQCHTLVQEHGVKMLINLMMDAYENGKHEEALDIVKWLATMAYGTPGQMVALDEPESQKNNTLPRIVVTKDTLDATLESDSDYT